MNTFSKPMTQMNQKHQLTDYIGLTVAARLLNRSERTVYRMENRGKLRSYRIPGIVGRIYLRKDVEILGDTLAAA